MSDLAIQIALIAITCFMNAFIIFNFMERIFSRVYRQKALYYGLIFAAGLILTVSNIFEILIINIAVFLFITLFTGIVLYGAKKSSDILTIFLFYMFLVLTEIIGQTITMFISTQPFSVSAGNITQSLITFFCYQITMFFIVKNKKEFNKAGNWITLVVIPVLSLLLIYSFMQLLTEQSSRKDILFTAAGCIIIFVINIVVFALFSRIAALNYKNEQYMLLESQRQLQYRYLNDMERNYEDSRRLFHDIKNHLNTIEQLCQQEHYEASVYANALQDKLDALNYSPPSNNRIVNILMNGWLKKSKKNGIEFRHHFEEVDLSFIADIDLNTILANLLDNAFDECINNGLNSNFIDLSICQINNFVVFAISNSCKAPPKMNDGRYISQKEKHMGLGLTNVKSSSEQYNGTMRVYYENNIFNIQITFAGRESKLPQ